MGSFPSLDLWEGLFDRPMSLNGYGWVEGNVVNQVDPSGMCWINNTATHNQQQACHAAFTQYNKIIYAQHPDWPIHISELVGSEAIYWGNLPYNDFVTLWNDNRGRPPASITPNSAGDIAGGSVSIAGAVSLANPFLGPEDLAAGGIAVVGLCVAGIALVASALGAGTIALPMRQTYYFPPERLTEEDEVIPIPFPRQPENRRWCCNVQCNVHPIGSTPNCPDRSFGNAIGRNQEEACRLAKRAANQSTPRGCYSRHCDCNCVKC